MEEIIKIKDARKMDVLNVKQVKVFVKTLGLSPSKEMFPVLVDRVKDLLKDAGCRAKSNGRVTIQAKDL